MASTFGRSKLAGRPGAAAEAAPDVRPMLRRVEDTKHLIVAWNVCQARRMPLLFAPTIRGAVTAGYRSTQFRFSALQVHDRGRDAVVIAPIPALSCRRQGG
jgi:hypothetical protein